MVATTKQTGCLKVTKSFSMANKLLQPFVQADAKVKGIDLRQFFMQISGQAMVNARHAREHMIRKVRVPAGSNAGGHH